MTSPLPAKIWQHRIQPTAPAAPISTGIGTIRAAGKSELFKSDLAKSSDSSGLGEIFLATTQVSCLFKRYFKSTRT